tara:strand:+ start:923 stop:1234 length:312 start_codon:yes stop_codon:yes gene_type:complete
MKRLLFVASIFILILLTAIIKNSTKEIEDKIFIRKENLRVLKKEYGNLSLEYNYLSSSKKLFNYQSLYFGKEFENKKLDEIKIILNNKENIDIYNFEIFKDND